MTRVNANKREGVALVIGIGDYRHPQLPELTLATVDAMDIRQVLVDQDVGEFGEDQVLLLTDAEAHRDQVVHRLSHWLPEQARGTDLVFIYFAGHGMVRRVGPREEGYLLPFDADPDDLATRGVAMSDLNRWIEGIDAGAIVVCLDCCHAGKLVKREGTTMRSVARDLGLGPAVLQEMAGKGRFLLASCDEGQQSIEVEHFGHGLFTYHLLQGLSGAGDRDGDGKVGVAELFEYVAAAVEKDAHAVGHVQRPWYSSMGTGGVYISCPKPHSQTEAQPDLRRLWREEGAAAAVQEIERRMAGASITELAALLCLLREIATPVAIALIFQCLTHAAAKVREQADRALQVIGWERVVAAIDELARQSNPENMGFILKGIAAYNAHPHVVSLLDHLVDCLKDELRNQAILLWEEKRLSLEQKKTESLFREIQSSYQIRDVLGQGLFTAVYLASDKWGEKEFVVRVLRPEFAAQPSLRAQFLDLSKKSRDFVHYNLVLTREVQEFPARSIYFAVRDYVKGVTLQQLLDSGKQFSPREVIEILRQLLQALTPLHERAIYHGGIKPSNIFFCDKSRVMLGDPSLPLQGVTVTLARLSYDYRYAAPEMFRSGGKLGPAADFYALGCVAYELVCGQPPFVSDNHFELAILHSREPVPLPSRQGSIWGTVGDGLILKLLDKSPPQRFVDLEVALEALNGLKDALRPKGRPDPTVAPLLAEASLAKYAAPQSLLPFISKPRFGLQKPTIRPGGFQPQEKGESSSEPSSSIPVQAPDTSLPQREAGEVSHVVLEPAARPVPGYELVKRLGRGGFGEVWEAKAPGGFAVALKIIHLGEKASEIELRGVELMKDIRHAHLLSTFGAWQRDAHLILAMELADGTLFDRLRQAIEQGQVGIPREELLNYMLEAAKGIDYLNSIGIQHRDIKPHNLLLVGGTVRVADFGLAKMLESSLGSHSGAMTPTYSPPEFLQGQTAPQSDQYSLAISYCELRTGKLPFGGENLYEVMLQKMVDTPDLSLLAVSEQPVVARALAKIPSERWPNCRSFVEALTASAQDRLVHPATGESSKEPVVDCPHDELSALAKPESQSAPSGIFSQGGPGRPADSGSPSSAQPQVLNRPRNALLKWWKTVRKLFGPASTDIRE
jgi:serine/threonine protein kinase